MADHQNEGAWDRAQRDGGDDPLTAVEDRRPFREMVEHDGGAAEEAGDRGKQIKRAPHRPPARTRWDARVRRISLSASSRLVGPSHHPPPSFIPTWWPPATTHRPVSSRPGGYRPPPTARFRPDLVATGHHPPPSFVPTWWLPATTHRAVSSRPGGPDHHPPSSFFPTWWPRPPPPRHTAISSTFRPCWRTRVRLSATAGRCLPLTRNE